MSSAGCGCVYPATRADKPPRGDRPGLRVADVESDRSMSIAAAVLIDSSRRRPPGSFAAFAPHAIEPQDCFVLEPRIADKFESQRICTPLVLGQTGEEVRRENHVDRFGALPARANATRPARGWQVRDLMRASSTNAVADDSGNTVSARGAGAIPRVQLRF
jgi:hypothetical protein